MNMSDLSKKVSRLKGLMETKHFGAKRRARHSTAKAKFAAKLRGSKYLPF